MSSEQISFRFAGDWPWWAGVGAALVLGLLAWILYRRDALPPRRWVRWLLPNLRALAVIMIVLMLSGPVLHHRKIIGQLPKLFLFVDGSRSMGLTDPSMGIGRKILALQRMHLLPSDAVRMELPKSAEALADAQLLSEKAKDAGDDAVFKKLASDLFAKIGAARDLITAGGGDNGDRLARFNKDLYAPSKAVAEREFKQINDRTRSAEELAKLAGVTRRWQDELADAFQKIGSDLASGENSVLRTALEKFDAMPRAQRVQSLLLEGEPSGMLAKFATNYDVQLLVLDGGKADRIWQPSAKNPALPISLPKLISETTNLSTGVKNSVSDFAGGERGAVILFSDGQHNEGESPGEMAKVLGARQVPVFTVGFGSQIRPRDLAIVRTEAPDSVFYQDRVRGQILLKDDMPAGMPFELKIQDGDKVLWQQQVTSDGTQMRKVPFDFSIKEVAESKLAAMPKGEMQLSGVPLDLKVSVSQIEGDREPTNNFGSLRLRAVTQKRKVLIIDGRPRWESRYLRNLFERDEQWEVNAIVAGSKAGENGFARGANAEEFPNDPALLPGYDLIIFGEVPRNLWKGDELQWIADFVSKRGGAIVFIDGQRSTFKQYAGTPILPLFPVEWSGAPVVSDGTSKLELNERSAGLAPFSLNSDKTQNKETWSKLQLPHWFSGAVPLPGSETLLAADVGGKKVPAIVYRPFGAGKVLYHAFDESWRWRFEVGDEFHVRYWNQIANWIAELPFAVRDKFISLDAGAATYRPGDSADIRVRLRDGSGKPVSNASVDAILTRDGKKVAAIRLSSDDNAGGLFHGKTAELEPGNYEVGIESAGIPGSELKARTSFLVEP
ncbi:MAG: hypothetical protein JWL90_4698, partial [Chthoniobacteraceae bacterium]|nr:hypothetical protein [Chthoniobacteraceae bacterium]